MTSRAELEAEISRINKDLKLLYNERELIAEMRDLDHLLPEILTQEELLIDRLTDLKKILKEFIV